MNEKKHDKQIYFQEKYGRSKPTGPDTRVLQELATTVLKLASQANRRDIINAAKKLLNTLSQINISRDVAQKNYTLMMKFLNQLSR